MEDETTNPIEKVNPISNEEQVEKDLLEIGQRSFAENRNEALAVSTSFNPTMYDKKLEKLQSYGSKYNTYGYNPTRDNESFYDSITSNTEQWGRSAQGAMKLASLGFNDSFLFGAFSDSKDNAKSFGQVADIYSTQRGGAMGFGQNLLLNSGYTVGIMADMVIEEAALALAAVPTFGGSVGLMGAKGIKSMTQISKAFNEMNKLKKAINAARVGEDVSRLSKVGKTVGNFLNPLEHSTKYISALKNVKSVQELGTLAKVGKASAALFRDVKAGQMAYSEARLEANMLEGDMYNEYLKENPYLTKEESDILASNIAQAKLYTTIENTAAIFATNKLVFNNMYKRFDDLKGVGKFLSTGRFGKLASTGAGTSVVRSGNVFQKGFYQGIKDSSKLVFEKGLVSGLKNIGKGVVSKAGVYGVSNVGEGLQELIQETIQAKNKYQFGNKDVGGYFDSTIHGLKEQLSAQGAETFLSGFLMGGMVHPITNVVAKATEAIKNKDYQQFTSGEKFRKDREAKLKSLEEDSKLINEAFQNIGDVYNSMGNNLAVQSTTESDMVEAAAEGNRHEFQNRKDQSFRSHLDTMMKHGMMDEFISHTEGFRTMDPKEAAQAFGITENITSDKIAKTIDKKVKEAKNFKHKYTEFKTNYSNPVSISSLKQDDPDYMEKVTFYHTWNKAVDDMIFDTAEFEKNLDRKIELLDAIKNDLEELTKYDSNATEVPFNLYDVITSPKKIQEEAERLSEEIETLSSFESLSPKAKKELSLKKERQKSLLAYQETLGEFDRTVKEIETLQATNLDPAGKKQLKKLKTKLDATERRLQIRHGAYVKSITDTNSKNLRVNNVSNKSFDKLMDYYKLENRNESIDESLSVLADPSAFNNYVDRNSKMADLIIENHKNYVKKSIAKFRDSEDVNKVISELLKAGVAFDMSELDELLEKGIMPSRFFSVSTEKELRKSDPLYKLAQQKLNELVDNLIEQPILEKEDSIYNQVGRGIRINDDEKRTYSELAKEYGFDVKDKHTSKDILNKIINSSESTKAEKELAKILVDLVSDEAVITFVEDSSAPNKYSEEGGSIIDARYSASNFTNSFFSIEESILKNELQRLTQSELEKDVEFSNKIKNLRDQVFEYIKTENDKLPVDSEQKLRTNWKGLESELEFIKEAFGNQSFQALLSQVSANSKTKTTWEKLVEAVSDLFGKFYAVNASVYNEVVSLVQQKIDPSTLEEPVQDDSLTEDEDAESSPVEPEATTGLEDVQFFDINDSIESYPKDLIKSLIDSYKQDVSKGDADGTGVDKLTPNNLTVVFKAWVDDNAQEMVQDYADKVNARIPKNTELLEDSALTTLISLGYTEDQINEMAPSELKKLIVEKNPKGPEEIVVENSTVNEIIEELVNIENDEDVSEETGDVDTGGEEQSNDDGQESSDEEVKQSEELTTAQQIEKAFAQLAAQVGEAVAEKIKEYADRIKAGESKDEIFKGLSPSFIEGINLLLNESPAEKIGNSSIHSKLVSQLQKGKKITGVVNQKSGATSVTATLETGEKILFYDHSGEVKVSDKGKSITLKLLPELKLEDGRTFTNVIQVYEGDRFMGNVAEKDFKSKDINLNSRSTEEDVDAAAAEIIRRNQDLFVEQLRNAKMKELGYSKEDVSSIVEAEKMRIVKNEIKKEAYIKEKQEQAESEKSREVRVEVDSFLKGKFEQIQTEEELIDLFNELANKVKDYESELPFIRNLFSEATVMLANRKDFAKLKVGDKLLMNNGKVVKVVDLKGNSATVVDFNSIIENKSAISKNNFTSSVKKVINDFNKSEQDVASALDKKNLEELSSIMSKFTTSTFSIKDAEVTDEDMLEHFKVCK